MTDLTIKSALKNNDSKEKSITVDVISPEETMLFIFVLSFYLQKIVLSIAQGLLKTRVSQN